MHAAIRRYSGASQLIDALDRRRQDVERLIATVPGFISYHAVRANDRLVTISIFDDRSGAEESTRRAAEWVRENLPAGAVGAPEVTDGEVYITFGSPQTMGAGVPRR